MRPSRDPHRRRRRLRDGKGFGAVFVGVGTKGRLEGSDLYGNKAAAVDIAEAQLAGNSSAASCAGGVPQ